MHSHQPNLLEENRLRDISTIKRKAVNNCENHDDNIYNSVRELNSNDATILYLPKFKSLKDSIQKALNMLLSII